MDDNWSAIAIALITATFGFFGIIATTFAAKWKSRTIVPGVNDYMLSSGHQNPQGIDVLMVIKQDMRQHDNDIKDSLRDIKELIRDGTRDVKDDLGEVKRDLDHKLP